jgi:hypothetical protein
MTGMQLNTGDWTDDLTLGLIEMANAFCTAVWGDFIDFYAHGDRVIRTDRFADITVDALVCDS